MPELNRDIWADDAAHAIDFIHWLLGVPESITAEVDSLCDPRVPKDNGIAMFRYPGGPLAEVFCSFTCVAAENTDRGHRRKRQHHPELRRRTELQRAPPCQTPAG